MAPPIDRAERDARRQQRVRGAGTSSAVADFNFSFDFAPLAAKHPSVPPQRTLPTPAPKQQTPRAGLASVKRRRSASVHGSSSARRHATPKAFATPQLGKRKRGAKDAQPLDDDGEPDELSPEQNNETNSIEQPTRVIGIAAPIREDTDEEPDELATVLDVAGSVRKHVAGAVMRSVPTSKTPTPRGRTPSAGRSATTSARSRVFARSSKPTEAPPETPVVVPDGPSRHQASPSPSLATPSLAVGDDEDELTPAPVSVTPRVVATQSASPTALQQDDEIDELSSPANSGTALNPGAPEEYLQPSPRLQPVQVTVPVRAKRGRPKRNVANGAIKAHSTPAATKHKHRRENESLGTQESANPEDSADELSPEVDRTRKPHAERRQDAQPVHRRGRAVEDLAAEEEHDEDQHLEQYEPDVSVLPAPINRSYVKPARKRPRHSGPKQAISVMRIKGSTVRGITVADTTRTILEENIDHQVQRMAAKMQTAEDSSRRKKLRGHINLALAFKESLVEKLMDLQDANDTLSTGFKKRKMLRKDNVERRKEILQIQNKRHEIVLEMDDERAVYDADKAKAEAKSKLNANLFEIQAAIQSGRERARREGREDEGPERPLSMLIDTVGRQVGSVGGGLLASLQRFNEGLERAAGWLEGRV